MKKRKIKAIIRSRSFKVTEVGINWKPVCDFLLVTNTDILSRNVSRLSQITAQILDTVFQPPFGGGVRGNVYCSSWAHWKARSGLPISVNWTFFARCYSWGATNENILKIGVLQEGGRALAKFSRTRRRPPAIIFTRIDMHYNFVTDSFHTKKLCSRLS